MRKLTIFIYIIVLLMLTTGCIVKDEEITDSAKKPVLAPTSTPEPLPLEEYPETIVQWMIPFSQGTDIDSWNRAIGESFVKTNDWRVIYTNISGGLSGSTGVYKVFNSKHDGYMFAGFSERILSIPVYVEGELTSKDWDFYIAGGCSSVLCVSADLGPNTLQEFINAAQNVEEDNEITIGVSGGGLQAALPFYFVIQSDIDFDMIEYKTDKYAVDACSNAEVDAIIMPTNLVKQAIDDHDLIPIAVMDDDDYLNYMFYEEKIPSIRQEIPAIKQEVLTALRQTRGFMLPTDTDASILLAIKEKFNSLAENTYFTDFVKENYANVYLYSGNEAREQVELTERYLCWILSDMNKTGYTPEYVGIERPY